MTLMFATPLPITGRVKRQVAFEQPFMKPDHGGLAKDMSCSVDNIVNGGCRTPSVRLVLSGADGLRHVAMGWKPHDLCEKSGGTWKAER